MKTTTHTADRRATEEAATLFATRIEINQIRNIIREQAARFAEFMPAVEASADDLNYAREVVAGRIGFKLDTGRRLFDVGRSGIDWAGGHYNHQEWPTQMGRFFMLIPLIRAYSNEPAAVYAEAARDYIIDWIDNFNCEEIETRGNTCMDIAIRLGTHGRSGWCCALSTFMDEPSWDDEFVRKVLGSIERQAHILWQRGIPSRPWGNHRIFGLDGLLHTALRLPFIADADKMIAFAVRNLEQACRFQFMPDGSYIEQSLGYHHHMAEIFVNMLRVGRWFPEVKLQLPSERLLKAAEYSLHTAPGGINDTSAMVYDHDIPDSLKATRRIKCEIEGGDIPESWRPALDSVYPDAGQVFLRSSWEPGADFLAFDASVYSGAHAHLARLGVVFRSGGRLWLADPGSFDYEMSNPFAIYGRSTVAHTTINLDGLNQGLGDAKLVKADITAEHALLHGVYAGGYWDGTYTWGFQKGLGRGSYGRHERIILWIRDEYMLILDAMMCSAGHTVEHTWQMAPVAAWSHDSDELSWTASEEVGGGFYLRTVMPPTEMAMSVYEGSIEPRRGWFSKSLPDSGFTPAPQIVFRYGSEQANRFYATLAMPLTKETVIPQVEPLAAECGQGFILQWPDGTSDVVALSASLAVPLNSNGILESDAPLVWLRRSASGAMTRHIMYDGTYLNLAK